MLQPHYIYWEVLACQTHALEISVKHVGLTQMLKCFEAMVINVQITIRKDGDVALAAPKKKKRQKTEKRQEGMERLCGV